MKVLYAVVAWLCIAFVLGLGIYLLAAKGSPWLFIVSVVGFVVAVGKIGCSTH